ncbi:MAG TPA: hypothetical protein VLJ86_17405 [Ramlibacter sp.]|nr:hypothetical protein [Ramlibacter sp.]
MIVVAFYKGRNRWSSRFLAWWMRSDYSHCEVVLSRDGDLYECGSSSFLDGGVRIKRIKLDPAHWTLYEVPIDIERVRAIIQRNDLTDGQAAAAFARAWFDSHAGEGYDVPGLLGFVFRRIKGWARAWWCSEACTAALAWADPWRFDVGTFLAVARTNGREHRGAMTIRAGPAP